MKRTYLDEKERYLIEAWLQDKVPVKDIALRLNRSFSTIYKEIKRGTVELIDWNLKPYKKYCADVAQRKYLENSKHKGVSLKAADNCQLLSFISDLIVNKRLSPYAVAVALKHSDFDSICEGTIYNYIRRGLIPGCSMSQMAYKKKKKKVEQVKRLPKLKDKPCIDERDQSILARAEFGHWEMDTVYSGRGGSHACLLVLTERMTRKELIYKMPDRTAASTVRIINKIERDLGRKNFKQMFKTITVDNGVEFMDYKGIVSRERTKLYYCHPYCSSERGSNENQNKLIRRWIPKGDDIGLYKNSDIQFIEDWINNLPRKMFNGLSSNDLVNLYNNNPNQ